MTEVATGCYLGEALQPPLASQHNHLNLMSTNHPHRPGKTRRLQWLVRVGYVLMGVGVLLVLLLAALPIFFFTGPQQYYRVVPTEHSWLIAALPMGLGVLLVLVARTLRSKGR